MKQRRIRNCLPGHHEDIVVFHSKLIIRMCFLSLFILFISLCSALLQAEEFSEKKPDITLSNFFSEGWKFGQWEEPEQEPD